MGHLKDVRSMFRGKDTLRMSVKRARSAQPAAYVFCDKKSGAAKFTVEADENGELPLDRIAGSLAVYCIAHCCSPNDLVLVVCADEELNESISARAAALLETARVGTSTVALSPREKQVLHAVTENLANKEIASKLSISVRTVKFHVSALLAKFGVTTRTELSISLRRDCSIPLSGPSSEKPKVVSVSASNHPAVSASNKKVSYLSNRSAAAYS